MRLCRRCHEVKPHGARGYCTVCYARQRRDGMQNAEPWALDPELAGGPYSFGDSRLPERFWDSMEVSIHGCWLWTATTRSGYGRFTINNRTWQAHSLCYMALVGPIPVGLFPDHACHTEDRSCPGGDACPHRACCNPADLELVTKQVNTLRGRGPSAQHARKTRCPQGHAYDEANTYLHQGRRYCRTCQRVRSRRRGSVIELG